MSGENEEGDYFPWSRLDEIKFELAMMKLDEKIYDETMAAIDADGGDISHLAPGQEPDESPVQEPEEIYP